MIHKNLRLRRLLLPLMRRLSFDFEMSHHWVPEARVRFDFFKHKNYWYHGKAREQASMEAFARLVPKGATVIDAGAHIGYVSIYLAWLAGPRGRVLAFEPGPDNRRYLERNLADLPNVEPIAKAASDEAGPVTLYCDNLTGQNNSLIGDFRIADRNAARSGIALERTEVKVEATTLDSFCAERGLVPDFVKIDVEGAELRVLRGMKSLLRDAKPRLMVEMTEGGEARARLEREIAEVRYILLSEQLDRSPERLARLGNKFCLHADDPMLAEIWRAQVR